MKDFKQMFPLGKTNDAFAQYFTGQSYRKEAPNQIKLIEIYASKAAYQAHIQSPHFQLYKTTTLKMVKDLKLIDMQSLNEASMTEIFKKLR